jgi:hypothetical protein
METYRPKIRSSQLFVQELPDELLVYDVERNQVHCLNGSAARVWTLCDGERTATEIARQLGSDLEPEGAEALVWLALDQFAEKGLLEEGQDTPVTALRPTDMTRRQIMLRLGLVVGMLPVVDSIMSPPAALAASPGPTGGSTGSTPP